MMNKKTKCVVIAAGAAVLLGLTVLFGYLGFMGKKVSDRIILSYTDEITMNDGEIEATSSEVKFENKEVSDCDMEIQWGEDTEDYDFLSMVKVIAPSGKVACYVTGDKGDMRCEFPLEEKGTYKITSEYYADAYEFRDAILSIDPGTEITIEEDGSFDGFIFDGEDGHWDQTFNINIVTSK